MIKTENLSMRFPNEKALNYRDLNFEDGKSYVVLGASGCGKSTLLNIISGVLTPSSGAVTIDGWDICSAFQKERDNFRIKRIGYIFQDFKLIEDMSVEDNIRLLELEKIDISGIDTILDQLGILKFKRRKVNRLSGGEKQRVAIARALIKCPDIILADEPTGNLNYEISSEIMDLLIKSAKGNTVIAVTHDDRLADKFDRIINMADVMYDSEEVTPND